MSKPAYYNEIDSYCVEWLRNLITAGHIPPGEVDDRSIVDVTAADLRGFGQCHFFAGIGGFGLACRLAAWPDDRQIWTGGFPCQPFSVAGRQLAQEDDRHLWPVLHGLIEQARPDVFIGENVAGIIDLALDGVLFNLEASGYASRAFVVPACAVNAPHRRDRVWISAINMADTNGELHDGGWDTGTGWRDEFTGGSGQCRSLADSSSVGCRGRKDAPTGNVIDGHTSGREEGASRIELLRENAGGDVGDANGAGSSARGEPAKATRYGRAAVSADWASPWIGGEYRQGADGKARRVGSGIRLLASGVPARVAKLRAGGNAIVPQVAAEIIKAVMAVRP